MEKKKYEFKEYIEKIISFIEKIYWLKIFKFKKHIAVQECDSDGEVEFFCGKCGKDFVYYNDFDFKVRIKVFIHWLFH